MPSENIPGAIITSRYEVLESEIGFLRHYPLASLYVLSPISGREWTATEVRESFMFGEQLVDSGFDTINGYRAEWMELTQSGKV